MKHFLSRSPEYAVLALLTLTGCAASSSDARSNGSSAPPITAKQDLEYSYAPSTTVEGATYTADNLPTWASVSTKSGVITGTPTAPGTISDIKVWATKDGDKTSVATFTLTVTGDPLKTFAWHLGNTGQKNFARYAGTSGADLNLAATVRQSILGEGVRIAISDSGTEITHEDLKDNVLTGESRDYVNGTVTSAYKGDPSPPSTSTNGDHGTSVAGLIAAIGWNGIGSRGIAPLAKFATFNYLADDTVQSTAISVNQITGDFDLFNQSWGFDADEDATIPTSYRDQLTWGSVHQPTSGARTGLGSIYVKASGNSFQPSPSGAPWVTADATAEYLNSSPYVVVVGALNAQGTHASYSSIGSVIWVSGTGGEDGADDPALTSTDRTGCAKGYSRSSETLNSFEKGSAENPACNYTSTFNGTSGAAPTVTGAIALILAANPKLGWRDVRHLLASTSKQVDTSFTPVSGRSADPTSYVWEPGWTTNAAGYKFHNYYGFGRVDVDRAVAAAQATTPAPWGHGDYTSANFSQSGLSLAIPDDSATGVSSAVTSTSSLTIEAVDVTLSLTHSYTGDLAVELTSPSGTKSVLLHANNYLGSDQNFASFRLLSNAFYGESASGVWTLKVIDGGAGDTGTLTSWKLTVYGH